MQIIVSLLYSTAVFWLIADLLINADRPENSPVARVLGILTGHSLTQLTMLNFRFFSHVSNKDVYSIWYGIMLLLAAGSFLLLGSLVLTLFTITIAIFLPRMLGEFFVGRALRNFEQEFLRFIQLVKSRHHVDGAFLTLIPRCISTLLNTSEKRLASGNLFLRVLKASQRNKLISDSFEVERQKLRSAGLKIKSLSLFMAILKAVEKTGQIGETFDQLEHRIQSDLAIRDELRAKTAGAKWEMAFMAAVPFFALAGYAFLMPDSVHELFRTVLGQCLLATASLVVVLAIYFAQRTLRVRV